MSAHAAIRISPFQSHVVSSKTPGMEKQTGPAAAIREFVRWSITPPQSYAVYLVALALVAGLSFYAGSLKPKPPTGLGPPPVSAPRH